MSGQEHQHAVESTIALLVQLMPRVVVGIPDLAGRISVSIAVHVRAGCGLEAC